MQDDRTITPYVVEGEQDANRLWSSGLPGTTNPRHGFSGISELGLPGTDDIFAGHDVAMPAFTPQAFQRGTHPFSCTQNDCGGDPEQHRGMAGVIIIQ